MALYTPVVLLPNTYNPSSHHEKNVINSNTGHSTKYLTSTPQNCPDHQKQGESEKLSQSKGAQGYMTVNVIWYPRWGPETEKRH